MLAGQPVSRACQSGKVGNELYEPGPLLLLFSASPLYKLESQSLRGEQILLGWKEFPALAAELELA